MKTTTKIWLTLVVTILSFVVTFKVLDSRDKKEVNEPKRTSERQTVRSTERIPATKKSEKSVLSDKVLKKLKAAGLKSDSFVGVSATTENQ